MKEFTLSLLILFNLGVLILVSYNIGRKQGIKAGIEYVNDNYVITYRDTITARLDLEVNRPYEDCIERIENLY